MATNPTEPTFPTGFDDKIQYEPGTEPTEETPDPNDCGCSMCCGTHVVVNCMGTQRPCDYCECDP